MDEALIDVSLAGVSAGQAPVVELTLAEPAAGRRTRAIARRDAAGYK